MGDQSPATTPRIYVACLAAYNNGHLHGAWIDADQDEEAIFAEIHTMLLRSPVPDAEEYAIHDYEGFGGVELREYSAINTVVRVAAFLAEHGTLGGAVLAYFSGDLDEASRALTHGYTREQRAGQCLSIRNRKGLSEPAFLAERLSFSRLKAIAAMRAASHSYISPKALQAEAVLSKYAASLTRRAGSSD